MEIVANSKEKHSSQKGVLSVKDLSCWIGEQRILSDINVQLLEKQVTTLIGPSGCGKTSFLSCLNRIFEMNAGAKISGTIQFQGTDILDPKVNLNALRQKIGMIFQKPNPFPVSIWKNLAIPLQEHGLKGKAELGFRIEESLLKVGLWDEVKDRLHDSALKLSGGQQQRLCIARAISLRPSLVLMDEPCSALDPLSSEVIEELILELRQHYSLVVVTHNLSQAKRVGDQSILFWFNENRKGYLVESGTTEELFNHPKEPLTKAYIQGTKG